MPKWNTISVSGYHMAEAGATPAQEIAFTLADAVEYVRTAIAAGMGVDDFAPRLSFFFVARTTLLEEVAKFRAARRIWARLMREEFGAENRRSLMLRYHTQTAGVQLTAQQPEVNLARVTVQALGAVLGGTQSLHTNAYDEAIALPTDKSARLALRTQQVLAYETDVTATVDPFAGSYVVESMTDELEAAALALMRQIEDRGGAVRAIEQGFQKDEIERSAYGIARETESGERVIVGVNRFQRERGGAVRAAARRPRDRAAAARAARPAARRARRRCRQRARWRLCARRRRARTNVLPPMKDALRARATVGEVCDALRDVWGDVHPGEGVLTGLAEGRRGRRLISRAPERPGHRAPPATADAAPRRGRAVSPAPHPRAERTRAVRHVAAPPSLAGWSPTISVSSGVTDNSRQAYRNSRGSGFSEPCS